MHSTACLGMLFCLAMQARAASPNLGLPIRCTLGHDCFIQNYFDHDPGPSSFDYTCGKLTYDGHHGTDFRLRDLAAIKKEIEVVASASGVVVAVRDGEPDLSIKFRSNASLKAKEAGNGVRIDHGYGWTTQYSHLLSGSVRVRVGQQVNTGDVLGMVGLSGKTEFPHVDFTVRKNGNPVDPFNPDSVPCGSATSSLWASDALTSLRYQATGLLNSNFSTTLPTQKIAEAGGDDGKTIIADAECIFFWVQFFGLRKGDRITLELYGADRQCISRTEMNVPADKAVWFAFSGKRRKGILWPKGTYSTAVRLERAGKMIIEALKKIDVW